MRPEPWRLVLDGAGDGAQNMAVDEAMLEAYGRGEHRAPTLRLYGWSVATYSLGRTRGRVEPGGIERLLRAGLEVVRRPTGGDAVLHEHERTYAVAGLLGAEGVPRGVTAIYARIARSLVLGLTRLGLSDLATASPGTGVRSQVCFERVSGCEIVWRGRKLVGSAQARRRGAFLQHGSIPIRLDPRRLSLAAGREVDGAAFTDLSTASGRALEPGEIDCALSAGFEEEFGVPLVAAPLTPAESLRAAELRAWRYDSLAWTRDGEDGDRERHWSGVVASPRSTTSAGRPSFPTHADGST